MAEAILDLRLDTVQPNRVRLVYGVQNDYNSRYICARFTVNGNPIDIEKTATVRINAKRPDGNKDAFPGTANTDGTAKVPVAQWMLDVPGEVSASITAVTTSGALTTQEFYIMAKASIWDSTGEPSAENPDKDVLQTIIASENERVAAESTRVANENARKSAETARATAETKRIADEAERVANEAGRVSAEEIRREEFATWQDEWGKISSFDKRLENIEAAVSPGLVTPTVDSTVAYSKTVPKGVLPNAAITEIGGLNYKCENLLSMSALDNKTINGVTFTKNADGTYTANGTATAAIQVGLHSIKADNTQKVWLSGGTNGIQITANAMLGSAFVQNVGTAQGTTVAITQNLTYDALVFYLVIFNGRTFANETFYGMVNKGETALPYQPYFTGLRDSKVTAVESVGANLLDMSKLDNLTSNGVVFTKNHEGKYTLSGTTTEQVQIYLSSVICDNSTKIWLSGGESGVLITVNAIRNGYFVQNLGIVQGTTIQLPQSVNYDSIEIHLIIAKGKTFSNVTFYAMLNQGSTALPYSPYLREALLIPGDALDGWGQGVNAQLYNKIVLDPLEGVKKYRQICAKRGYLAGDETRADVLTDGKNETVYILENPVETDVSAYFTDDNLLHVEAGGTITAVNEYEQAVPTSIEYTVKGA